ncbi:hypothetical protein ACXHPF_16950, partial [Vibrio cincinnatiensis]
KSFIASSLVNRIAMIDSLVSLKLVVIRLFIAYCQTLHNFKVMLESMYGVTDGKTDQLLRFTRAVTGAYFFAPSQEMLAALTIQ